MTSTSDDEVYDDVFVSMYKRGEILSCDPFYLRLIHRQPNVGAFLRGCGPYVWLHHLRESALDNTLWLDLCIAGERYSDGLLALYSQPTQGQRDNGLSLARLDQLSLVQLGWTFRRDHFLSWSIETAHAEGLRLRLRMFEELAAVLDPTTKEAHHED
jgi:hypothetical protein